MGCVERKIHKWNMVSSPCRAHGPRHCQDSKHESREQRRTRARRRRRQAQGIQGLRATHGDSTVLQSMKAWRGKAQGGGARQSCKCIWGTSPRRS